MPPSETRCQSELQRGENGLKDRRVGYYRTAILTPGDPQKAWAFLALSARSRVLHMTDKIPIS